jgi:hypothetical protein
LASEPNRSFYVFQGGPVNVNVSFSLIHSVDREGEAKLLWGFHSGVRKYDEVKLGDIVFLYATSPISTVVASGFVVEKFEERIGVGSGLWISALGIHGRGGFGLKWITCVLKKML